MARAALSWRASVAVPSNTTFGIRPKRNRRNTACAAWRETVLALITEFGRTARINGNEGTDHGTATVALLAGGALKGGRVIADWPGVKEASLYQNRDLRPTTDLRAVLKGLLKDHLRVEDRPLSGDVFPDSGDARPMEGLLA